MLLDELLAIRRSVRTFAKMKIENSILEKLDNYIQSLTNPFDVPCTIKILDKEEYHLSSPVIQGEDTYMAIKAKRKENFELASAYIFTLATLKALELGLGSVILAGSLNRPAFNEAMNLQDDEVLVVASPLGYTAKKKSFKENVMRLALHADKREDFSKLFFKNDFFSPLSEEDCLDLLPAFLNVRKGPSAINRQPWRLLLDEKTIHFYEHQTIPKGEFGDVQLFDIGIAYTLFTLSLTQLNKPYHLSFANPDISTSPQDKYVLSVVLD